MAAPFSALHGHSRRLTPKSMHRKLRLSIILLLQAAASHALDLSNAVVVMPAEFSAQEKKAVSMLVEEVEKRTQLRWPIQNSWPAFNGPVIAIASQSQKSSLTGHFLTELKPENNLSEGFRLVTSAGQGSTPSVFIIGNDARGVLFGIG